MGALLIPYTCYIWTQYIVCWNGDLGGVFSNDNTPKGCIYIGPQKLIFPNKQVSGIIGDHVWLRMTNSFILCDLLWEVQKVM